MHHARPVHKHESALCDTTVAYVLKLSGLTEQPSKGDNLRLRKVRNLH
jgi:hypothetical protein